MSASPDLPSISPLLVQLRQEIAQVVVGQAELIDRLILGLLADGHILIEGAPGLAKTTAVKALADCIRTSFARIQFTPDLLPADLVGTEIFRPQTGAFTVKKGPVFANVLLADEINRAPAKVQSALLEAMQERQVTLGETTHALPHPFIVLATQNPVEQEGTYPLPEAQLDRFMLKLLVGYPSRDEEKEIMRRQATGGRPTLNPVCDPATILKARGLVNSVYLDAKVEDYIVDIVFATREPSTYNLPQLDKLIVYGASPRATIALARAAKAYALMAGRSYVTPQDIKTMAPDILRHRIVTSYEAEAQEMRTDAIVQAILSTVDVP